MRLGFVFPGQGSQNPGMGKELAENHKEAAVVFEKADEIAGFKLSKICFEGSSEIINKTEYAQPALLTTSLAAFEVVKSHGIKPVVMAGLSLGEYTALVAAGAMSFEEALPLVQVRSRLMQEAVPEGKGAMAAVMGLDDKQVDSVCRTIKGVVSIANYNCPGQTVISGETRSIIEASALLKEYGARVVPLAVSVPCHSELLYDAAQKLRPYLKAVRWQEPSVEVISNVNVRSNRAKDMVELLVKQLYSPVMWEQSVRYMIKQVDYFVEIGHGSSLSGLIKRIDRNKVLGQVEDSKSLDKLIKKVRPYEEDRIGDRELTGYRQSYSFASGS
jgi:[acyl-carrier-protein] S-malonyltransferase